MCRACSCSEGRTREAGTRRARASPCVGLAATHRAERFWSSTECRRQIPSAGGSTGRHTTRPRSPRFGSCGVAAAWRMARRGGRDDRNATVGLTKVSGRAPRREAGEFARGRLFGGFGLGGGRLSLSGRAARSDGFTPVTADTRGPVDRNAPYKEANVRVLWAAPLAGSTEIQLSGLGFHRPEGEGHGIYRQPHRWRRRRGPAGQPRTLAVEPARLCPVARA